LRWAKPSCWWSASSHRKDAFAAAEFLMDFLKTEAPFWKKEIQQDGSVTGWKPSTATSRRRRWQ
jgi:molybdopterin synthase catalytic subunit